MLVILIDEQLISPQVICQGCLLADQSGQPRWRSGQLRCGQSVHKLSNQQPNQFQCVMGFRVASIEIDR